MLKFLPWVQRLQQAHRRPYFTKSMLVMPVLGLRALGLGGWQPVEALRIGSVDIRPVWESAWVREVISNDPAAKSILASYLSGLSSAGYSTDQQGVWIAAGTYRVAQHQGDIRRPAASLSKIATTLAALSTWGPEHRFETLVGWQGQLENGVILGDLVIEGGDDPLFVWEEAITLGNAIQQLGIRRVTGDIIVTGNFTMNFEVSPAKSGMLLKQALNAAEWDYEIQGAYQRLSPGLPKPTLQIDGQVSMAPVSQKNRVDGWLIRHESLPLVAVLKAMNIYSNNPMAEQIANTLGGPEAVIQEVATVAGVEPGELVLINGSGLGEANQMSPRAAVAMFQTVQDILRASDYTVADIFPIAGRDGGTLIDRNMPNNTVVKTGSLAVVSALAGAVPTQKKGLVWFSLINYGSGLDNLRSRQDQIISAVEKQWGQLPEAPADLKTTVRIGQEPYQFGSGKRNQSIAQEGKQL